MPLQIDHSLCLPLVLLAALPWVGRVADTVDYSWTALLPPDPLSAGLGVVIKLLASMAIASCVLGIAGLHLSSPPVEHVGQGAQIVLLLDRSRSMDEPFAGAVSAGAWSGRTYGAEESKGAAARRLLVEFARHRDHDLISMVAFTTIPIRVMGFTPRRDMVEAAIFAGNVGRGLAETDVGLGLFRALAQFDATPYNGSRVIVLVSDGGAHLDIDTQQRIAQAMKRERASLYWLYLRTTRSPGLNPGDAAAADEASEVPEHLLHRFFSSMGSPYHAYEAEDPLALRRAIEDVDRLERLPLRYEFEVPRRDLTGTAYAVALMCAAVLCLIGAFDGRAHARRRV